MAALQKLPDLTPFEQARERWARATAARRELMLDGARMALAVMEFPQGDRETRSPIVAERAAAYVGGRRVDPDRLRFEIRALQDQLADVADQQQADAAAWRQALEVEQQRLAVLCRPRHATAVTAIARCVEKLSAAVQSERDARAELADVGALHVLPDAGFEFGTLSEYESLLSRWNRRLLASGAL